MASLDTDARTTKRVRERLDERLRLLGPGRIREARAVALPRVGEQRELAHDERITTDVEERAIEATRLVGEDPKAGDLRGEPSGVFGRVIVPGAEEHQETPSDRSDHVAIDPHGGARDPLDHGSHARNS